MLLFAPLHEAFNVQGRGPAKGDGPGVIVPVIRLWKPEPTHGIPFTQGLDDDGTPAGAKNLQRHLALINEKKLRSFFLPPEEKLPGFEVHPGGALPDDFQMPGIRAMEKGVC